MVDISVQNLTKFFVIGENLLEGLSFEIQEGECVAILARLIFKGLFVRKETSSRSAPAFGVNASLHLSENVTLAVRALFAYV